MKPGDILPNGATVIAARRGILFCLTVERKYATWKVAPNGFTIWGEYFGDRFDDAVASFRSRAGIPA